MAKKKTSAGVSALDDLFSDVEVVGAEEVISAQANYRVYSTGCLMLDCAIGRKDPMKGNMGIPERTIVEHFGQNQSLKTATYEQLAKNILEDDPENIVIVFYAEESDMSRWEKIGVTPDQMRRIKALSCYKGDNETNVATAEKSLDRITIAAQDARVKLIVIDSIKAMPLAQQVYDDNGQIRSLTEKEQLMMRSKMIESFLLKFKVCNKKSILYMTNQIADNVQLGPGSLYVNPRFTKKTPGGRNMEFECMLRIEGETRPLYHKQKHPLTGNEILIGWEASFRIVKNKFCKRSANRMASARFLFDPELNNIDHAGFDHPHALLMLGEFLTRKGFIPVDKGIVLGGGGYYNIKGNKVRSETEALGFLRKEKKIAKEIEIEICRSSDYIFDPIKETAEEPTELEKMF